MKSKFLKIYIPFVILSLGFVTIYSFLNWLIIIKLELFQPKELIINYVIPVLISAVLVLFVMRKRIKLLKITEKSREFFGFMCWIFLTIPVVIGQFYMENKLGEITVLDKPSLIEKHKSTLFYSIKQNQTLNKAGGLWVTRTNADKYGNEIRITCYFACPIIDPIPINTNLKFKNWIGVAFAETFSNRAFDDKEEQKKKINDFINSSIAKFENYRFNTYFLRNLRNSDDRNEFYSAVERIKIQTEKKDLVILKEEKGTYETRTGSSHSWLLGMLLSTNIIWFFFVFIPELNTTEVRKLNSSKEKEKRKRELKEVLFLFTPSRSYWATPIIIDLNILIFLVMVFSGVGFMFPQGNELINWGASYTPLIAEGQWWRLITSTFLHAGIIHLTYNMFALIFIGPFLESSIGSYKFIIFYLLTGFLASLNSLLFHDNMIGVGASGAIFGMYGLLASLMLLKLIDKNLTKMLGISVGIFIVMNLIMGINGNIDMAAHLGGLISGFALGFIYFPLKKFLAELY